MAYSKIVLNGETLMDVTIDTVDAEDLLSGETATKNDGTKITGSYTPPSTSSLTVTPTESQQTFNATEVYGYKPVTVNGISSTYVGTGITQRSSVTFNGKTAWALAGYYSSNASANMQTANIDAYADFISSTGTISYGYSVLSEGYKPDGAGYGTSYTLPIQSAQTIYPSTTDQTISSYRWLTGSQTIKSVTTSNLTAANIASGVTVKVGDSNNASRISQITGTYSPATSNLTVTPTESQQVFNATGVYGYKPVTVNGISSTYVGTGISWMYSENLIVNGSTIATPSGYYPNQVSKHVSAANSGYTTLGITSSTGLVSGAVYVNSEGYVNTFSRVLSMQLLTQAAQTITPTATNQYISSYRWLTESQTILGDSNLVASNIAEGVSIFGVNGTHSGAMSGRYIGYITSMYTNAYNKLIYNSSDYTTSNTGIVFSDNDSITVRQGDGMYGTIYLNDSIVSLTDMGTASYTFTPNANFDVSWDYQGAYINTYLIPSGSISIISNGIYDIKNYVSADINVPIPSGYIYPSGRSIITANGIYDIKEYEEAAVQVGAGYGTDQIAQGAVYGTLSGNTSFISEFVFAGWNIQTASFPSVVTIGASAFMSCKYLLSVYFSNAETVMNSAFFRCDSLVYADFPKLKSINTGAFRTCYSLASFSFPEVIYMAEACFYGCSQLSYVYLPKLSSFSYGMNFQACVNLETVNFPILTQIAMSTFYSCYKLSNCSFPLVTNVSANAFGRCSSLSVISLPKANAIGSSAFISCSNLRSLYLMNSSGTYLSSINAFYYTPIEESINGVYGSIFVPRSLYASYIVSKNWSNYSARIVSV